MARTALSAHSSPAMQRCHNGGLFHFETLAEAFESLEPDVRRVSRLDYLFLGGLCHASSDPSGFPPGSPTADYRRDYSTDCHQNAQQPNQQAGAREKPCTPDDAHRDTRDLPRDTKSPGDNLAGLPTAPIRALGSVFDMVSRAADAQSTASKSAHAPNHSHHTILPIRKLAAKSLSYGGKNGCP